MLMLYVLIVSFIVDIFKEFFYKNNIFISYVLKTSILQVQYAQKDFQNARKHATENIGHVMNISHAFNANLIVHENVLK